MSKPAHKNDASMDDILASIRSIISDDVKQSVGGAKNQVKSSSQSKQTDLSSKEGQFDADQNYPMKANSPKDGTLESRAVESDSSPAQEYFRDEDISMQVTQAIPNQKRSLDDSITDRIRSRIRAEVSHETIPASSIDSLVDDAISPFSGVTELSEPQDSSSTADTLMRQDAMLDANHEALNFPELLSDETVERSLEALSSLDTVMGDQKTSASDSSLSQKTVKTLEDIMQEALRPLLREWLDRNLPVVVRSVVREQIEKILALRQK
ncbi:MAG: DUF2497 domain-containing protein [Alphaproteobacteria bacterium]|nr:MAG: DUF2497 domain-containing protein [Alphaproteobacteria bacterium]